MQKLWYNYDEVKQFHPIVATVLNDALSQTGYHHIAEVVHHPSIPNSSIVPDFGIRLKNTQRYVFILEVKRSNRDVYSQRYQNQARNYVTEFAPYWQHGYHHYFCITNVEQLVLFADRQGPLSTCILKNNPSIHPPFRKTTHDATTTIGVFQTTIATIFKAIFTQQNPDWANNWLPIIEHFHQNFLGLKGSLLYEAKTSEVLSLYELFRLLTFVYLREFYVQNNNTNQSYFRGFPSERDNFRRFSSRLENSYNRITQLDFKQVFSNHPNAEERLFPDNFSEDISQHFKDFIQSLNHYSSQAVRDNPSPSYVFNLLTSKIYDWEQMNRKGKVMSDTELAHLLATLSIQNHTDKVLDPCCGDGALLEATYDRLEYLAGTAGVQTHHNGLLLQTTGIEIDPFLAQLATFRLIAKNLIRVNEHTIARITIGDAFAHPRSNGFDVLVMNPPFLRNDNPAAPITYEAKQTMINAITQQGISSIFRDTKQPNLYFYFVNYAWHYLNENGRAGIILMAKFLNNKDGVPLKAFLLDKIDAIIAYPRSYFTGFSVTTVIVMLSKRPTRHIKFLNVLEESLLENPTTIQRILQGKQTTIGVNYTLAVTDRTIDPKRNWKRYLIDPDNKFDKLQQLTFLNPLTTFFGIVRRGGAENSGGSKIIYPDFSKMPFRKIENIFVGYGIKNSRHSRNYILTLADLNIEKAIHFPARYDKETTYGLSSIYTQNKGLWNMYKQVSTTINKVKWGKILNSAYRNQKKFDILLPRAARAKHSCYFNPLDKKIVLSTNFFYLSDFQNGNTNRFISTTLQKKFIAAYLLSSFGQIQYEINSNNQEGLRKIEGFHIAQFKVPDVRQLTKTEIQNVVNAFDTLNNEQISFRGDEGIATPRKDLDRTIGQIIYPRNHLGFSSVDKLVQFFQLFLAELVNERNPNE